MDTMLEKKGTCAHCGYENRHCQCNEQPEKYPSGYFNYYGNTWSRDNFAITSRIQRHTEAERKFMEELLPIDKEDVKTYLERSDIAMQKLIEHSIWYHLYGTKKGVWPCHSSSRYCFICNLAQFVEINRTFMMSMNDFVDLSQVIIRTESDPSNILPKLRLERF